MNSNLEINLEDEGVVINKDYDALFHKPTINNVELVGDLTLVELGIQERDANYVHTDNNYTTEEKNKLANIEANAEVNDIDIIKVNDVTQTITDKTVNIHVPTNNNELTNGAGYMDYNAVSELVQETCDIPPQTVIELKNLAENLDDVAMLEDLPTKTSDLTNDSNFATVSQIPTKITDLQNDSDFTTTTFVSRLVDQYSLKATTVTLISTNWVLNTTTNKYEYTVTDNTITANHKVNGDMDLANQDKMKDGYIQSFAGGYKVITSELPTENITMDITIQLTKSNGGS